MTLDDAAEVLRARGLRVTPQRRAILDVFSGTPGEHLSADEVHAHASSEVPEIGRGTVYATLAELTEIGVLAAIGAPEPVRYEVNTAPHQHFRCRLCLRTFDVALSDPDLADLDREGFVVEGVTIRVDGVCVHCKAYEQGLRAGAAVMRAERRVGDDVLADTACITADTPLGMLALAATANGLVRVAFEDHHDWQPIADRAASRRGPRAARQSLKDAAAALDAYFAGRPAVGDAVLAPLAPTEHPRIVDDTRRIPRGSLRSYDQLAPTVTAFDCGYAMGSNPVPVLFPCHRVSRGAQRPDAYVGGSERLRLLRSLEDA